MHSNFRYPKHYNNNYACTKKNKKYFFSIYKIILAWLKKKAIFVQPLLLVILKIKNLEKN